jgi:RimJ/RimL family protein N-acetyltransferase
MAPYAAHAIAPDEFRTSRLRGVRLNAQHFAEMRAIDADESLQQALFRPAYSEGESRARLETRVTYWEIFGFGDYVVYTLDDAFAGMCSLFVSRVVPDGAVEIGYVLRPGFWKRGYATEMVEAVLAIGFEALELTNIYAATDAGNLASRHVMEKCGMTFVHDYLHHERRPSVLYRIGKPS